jgi:L-lysine 6-transaminase
MTARSKRTASGRKTSGRKASGTTSRAGRRPAARRQTTTRSTLARPARSSVRPSEVLPTLARHLLVDGFEIVIDLKKSKGSYLVDAKDGKRYLDFFTFVASSPLGMNHPKMATPAFREKIARVALTKPSLSDIYAAEQAEFLATFERVAMPAALPHAFFVEGGALGVENALKAAFDWKIRKNQARGIRGEKGTQIIHFRQCFHGRTGYTLSLTNTDPVKTALYPKFAWPRVHNPALRFPVTDQVLAEVRREEEQSLREIAQAFHERKDDIAAIIIEPIQGEGGDNHFRKEFFEALRRLADENEAMLILDEVQTGIGMTGKMWAYQHFVEPDMISFGKKMQVCGFLCGRRIDEVRENVFVTPSRINSTWGGNLTDMVRAQRYLEIIEEDGLVENARVVGEHLLRRLGELAAEFPAVVSNPRGRGLYAAFDTPNGDVRTAIRTAAFRDGLIILPSGDRSIRFRPPLTVTTGEIDLGLRIIREAVAAL